MATRKHADDPKNQPSLMKLAVSKERVVLNHADCDLDFDIGSNGLHGCGLHELGFAHCWSGARANMGINGGKYCFGCKITANQPVQLEGLNPAYWHLCTIGISRGDDAVGKLGESKLSFGSFAMPPQHGGKFRVGDTIICAVDLAKTPAEVSFSRDGISIISGGTFNAGPGGDGLGVVGSPTKSFVWESALFPHILLRNVAVKMQFSREDGLVPLEGYKPWADAFKAEDAVMGPPLKWMTECEVRMMVGLPNSGKTTWAEKYVKEHPEKRYVLLGINLVLDQMKIPEESRKNKNDQTALAFKRMMHLANGLLGTLLCRASKVPRNFILDQPNVSKISRTLLLKPFADFRKIAVVVFVKPAVLKSRQDKRVAEMGNVVQVGIQNLIGYYDFPTTKNMPTASGESFDEVVFTELSREESQIHLDKLKSLFAKKNVSTKSVPSHSGGSSLQSSSSSSLPKEEIISGSSHGSSPPSPTRGNPLPVDRPPSPAGGGQ